MAVRDQATLIDIFKADYTVISTDTTTVGPIYDTADYELGFTATIGSVAWTDGTYTLKLEESDDSGMAGAVVIPASKLIGSLPAVSALTADGAELGKVGVFSNLRYIRVSVVSTSTTTGAAIITNVIQGAENLPA